VYTASSQPDDDTGEADDCSLLDEFAAAAAGLSTDAAGEEERVKPAFLTRKPVYLNYTEARKWARAMGMGSRDEWEDWAYNSRRNPYIPRDPEKAYGDQFTNWDDVRKVLHPRPLPERAPFRSRPAAHAFSYAGEGGGCVRAVAGGDSVDAVRGGPRIRAGAKLREHGGAYCSTPKVRVEVRVCSRFTPPR